MFRLRLGMCSLDQTVVRKQVMAMTFKLHGYPCPLVGLRVNRHPCSPAFADPGGGCRPGPERAERSLALVLLGQGLCRAGRVRGSRDSGRPDERLKKRDPRSHGPNSDTNGGRDAKGGCWPVWQEKPKTPRALKSSPPNRFYKREGHSARRVRKTGTMEPSTHHPLLPLSEGLPAT